MHSVMYLLLLFTFRGDREDHFHQSCPVLLSSGFQMKNLQLLPVTCATMIRATRRWRLVLLREKSIKHLEYTNQILYISYFSICIHRLNQCIYLLSDDGCDEI